MFNREFIKSLERNFFIVFVSILFIIWKFFLIQLEFSTPLSDSRFNDAKVYIQHIESINQNGSLTTLTEFISSFEGYGGFEHLTYRLFFGGLAYFLGISSERMFILSFYIGTIILVPVMIIFLRIFSQGNRNLLAFSLFFLGLFNGAGSYHGFFWVVPSFFALVFFLLIFSSIIGNFKHWKIYITILTPLLLYTHFIGLYFSIVPLFFTIIYFILSRKFDTMMGKRALYFIAISLIFYIPTSIHLQDSPYSGNPYGVETFAKELGQENLYFPGFTQIQSDYFNWVFPNWTAFFGFIAIILILIRYEQNFVLTAYSSSLLFTLLSSSHIFGMRSLLITWPMTYLLYAYGFWFSFVFIRDAIQSTSLKKFLYGIGIILIALFTALNAVYSYLWNSGSQEGVKNIVRGTLF